MPQSESPTKMLSLVSKLAEVMAAVERVPKRGRNEFHKYDYATEADIVTEIRQELAKRHVLLVPGIDGCERIPVGDKGSMLTHLSMTFTFLDGDSGEELTRHWMGAGSDKDDKGLYKAMTGGEKYFLLKTFLIPTGDDPELDTATNGHSKTAAPPALPSVARETAIAKSPAAAHGGERAASSDPPPTQVTRVDAIKPTGKNYTKYTVHFHDGRKATTVNNPLGLSAIKARDSGTLVSPVITPGKFPNTFDLISLDVPTRRAAPPVDAQQAEYDDQGPPPWMEEEGQR